MVYKKLLFIILITTACNQNKKYSVSEHNALGTTQVQKLKINNKASLGSDSTKSIEVIQTDLNGDGKVDTLTLLSSINEGDPGVFNKITI